MVFFGPLTWGPSYLAQARGFDIKGIGAATFVIFLCGAVGSLVGGFLCDLLIRKGVRRGLAAKGLLTVSASRRWSPSCCCRAWKMPMPP